MTESEVAKIVKEIIALEAGCDIKEVTDYARLSEDLGCDSLDFTEIIMSTEHKFDIIFGEHIFEKMNTPKELIEEALDKLKEEG